jgi:hypothetical protein
MRVTNHIFLGCPLPHSVTAVNYVVTLKVLAAVDPQVFWAAILRFKKFVAALQSALDDAMPGTRDRTNLDAAVKGWKGPCFGFNPNVSRYQLWKLHQL